MAAYSKYQDFTEQLYKAVHNFFAAGHTIKVALSNTAPNVATHDELADVTEIAAGNGYTAGGEDTQNDASETTGTLTETAVDVVWTAVGGAIASFRYVIRHNDTSTTDKLINYWDYGSSIAPAVGETFTVDFGASVSSTV